MDIDVGELQRLREEYDASLDEVERRRAAYHRAIHRLHLSGVPLREIAHRLGVSHQRVHQIVTGEATTRKRTGGRVSKGIAAASILALVVGGGYLLGQTGRSQLLTPSTPLPLTGAIDPIGRCMGGNLARFERSPRTARPWSLIPTAPLGNVAWVGGRDASSISLVFGCRPANGSVRLDDVLVDWDADIPNRLTCLFPLAEVVLMRGGRSSAVTALKGC